MGFATNVAYAFVNFNDLLVEKSQSNGKCRYGL